MQDSPKTETRMTGEEFSRLRKLLGKSQKELADILGISRKAVESYGQGWRKVPANTERMLYFLLFKLRGSLLVGTGACWEIRSCPDAARQSCMTWLAQEGHFCWFFTGRLCAARRTGLPENLSARSRDHQQTGTASGDELSPCRDCSVFRGMIDLIREADVGAEAVAVAAAATPAASIHIHTEPGR